MSNKDIEAFKAFEKELKSKYPKVEDFLTQTKLVISEIITNKEGIFNKKSLDRLIYSFNKTMIDNCFWTIHSLQERIIDSFNLDRTSPDHVKEALHIAWEILINLYHKDLLGITSMEVKEDKYTIKKIHKFIPKSPEVNSWMMLKHLSRGISFSPIKVDQNKHVSKDMVETINKLNSIPIKLNMNYLIWIIKEIAPKIIDPTMQDKLGWITPDQKERIVIAFKTRIMLLTILNDLMSKIGAKHFYIQWKHDFRGRLYPKLTNISHMSHKFIRPIFITNSIDILLSSLKDTLSGKDNSTININYINTLEQTFGIKIQEMNFSIMSKLLITLADIVSNPRTKIDFNKINRILELSTLMDDGKVTPAPMQIDSTCNVIQHISSITGNAEIMKTIGLITDESVTKDFYTTIARKVMELIKDEIENSLDTTAFINISKLTEILETIDIKILRDVIKKPTITKAYAAKYITAMEYIKERFVKHNINISYNELKILTDVLMIVLSQTLSKEITMISIIQKLVKNATKTISWTMSPISDFKVYMENMKSYIQQTKLHTTINNRKLEIHTTFKVITNTPNTIKNSNAIFVNVIHSLDALHIALILKSQSKDILPIHDALLLSIDTDMNEIKNAIHSTFLRIHGNNTTYKRITKQICEDIGDITLYEYVLSIPNRVFSMNEIMWKLS